MDKLTAIKIKYDDGTYSDEIPVSVLSKNVEWDSTHTLVDILGSIDVDATGTIQDQISRLFNEKVSITQLNNYVASQLNTDVANWLNNNVDPVGSAVIVDKTLTIEGAAADAKKTGDELSSLNSSLKDASNANSVFKTTLGDRLFAIECALYLNSVFKTTVGDRLFAIESALNKLNTGFSTKQYDYVLDEKLEPILDEIGDPIIANGTDLVLSGPAFSEVKDYLFNNINSVFKTVGYRLFDIESALNVNSVFKTTVGDRLFAIESALNKLNTGFSTKQYDYVLDEKLEPILDEIGDPIIANGTDLVLSGSALSGVKDYLFNPESENRWNVWGWSGKTVVIPILYVYGHIPESKGEGKLKVRYRFKDINGQDLTGIGKIGVQGQSSAGLPKKNYSITFADKFLAKNDWLPSKKYTFKSCYNDPTWARNAVSGRLWAQCVASRPNVSYESLLDEKKEELLDQNGDAITVPSYPIDVYSNHGTYDGFPIYIIANGKYIGLYTMLIAKDKDMFGIGQYKQYKKTECVVSNEGAGTGGTGGFKAANLVVDAEKGEDVSGKSTAWTYECIPNEKPKPSDYDKGVDDDAYKEDLSKYEADNTKFRASLNTMIQSVVDSTGKDNKDTNYKKVSAQYLDYDSVVDYMIFSSLINAADDVGKNWLLVTYDGTKWFFSAYDLDTTWGNWCPDYNKPNLLWRPDEGSPSLKDWNDYNRAMHMIWTYDPQRLIDRYEYLRSTVFSEENVYREFLSFIRKIPMNAIEADRRLFRTEPNGMDFAQLENWYRLRVKEMDKQIEDLKASIATA